MVGTFAWRPGKKPKKKPNQIALDFGKAIEHTVRCAQVINLQRKTDPIYRSGVTFSSLFLFLGSIPIWGFQRPITISRKVECRSSLQSSSQVHRKLVIVCMAIRRAAEKIQKKAHETPHHLESFAQNEFDLGTMKYYSEMKYLRYFYFSPSNVKKIGIK